MQASTDSPTHFDVAMLAAGGPKNFRSAREYAYTLLRDHITGMLLSPGTLLTEKSVAEMLQISATPVREAFVKLREDGLLVVYPQRGTYVSKISMKKTLDARLVRKTLERELVNRLRVPVSSGIAMEMRQLLEKQEHRVRNPDRPESPIEFVKLDNAFHRQLFVSADLENVWDMIQQFSMDGDRLRVLYFKTQCPWNILLDQHHDILLAATGESGQPLLTAWEQHFHSIEVNFDKILSEYEDYFV